LIRALAARQPIECCSGHFPVELHAFEIQGGHHMFVRIRKSTEKLRLSLVETSRVSGKVRQEHVASLGSIPQSMTAPERREFWSRLDVRFASLGNRIDLDAVRALIAVTVPPPSKAELDILDLEDYAEAWQRIADVFRPLENPPSPAKEALRAMSDGVKAKEYAAAAARVAKAKERIERVRNGEDAGLKEPFDPSNPAYRAAVDQWGRAVQDMYLIDEARFREILSTPEAVAEIVADKKADEDFKAHEGRWAAEREKRSKAARKGWSRYYEFFEAQRDYRKSLEVTRSADPSSFGDRARSGVSRP
jgi:hypothetical protein